MYLAGDNRSDCQGMPLGALRLVAYHYRGHYQPPDPRSGLDTHLRFGVLIKTAAVPSSAAGPTVVSELIKSLADAKLSMSEPMHQTDKLWNVTVAADMSEPAASGLATVEAPAQVSLTVVRNLSCSESLTDNKNQSLHTRWNCLVSRQVDGVESVAGHMTINGELAPEIPSHLPTDNTV